MEQTELQLRRDALSILDAAIRAAHAGDAVRRHLRALGDVLHLDDLSLALEPFDRVFLVAAGKAATDMAEAVSQVLGSRLTGGLVVTKRGHWTKPLQALRILEAAHPLPDEAGLQAAEEVLALAASLTARDLLIVAVSGGASSLLPAPVPGLSLEEKQRTTDLLLRCGASIEELNAVRKHLSRIKGGQLAALAWPATVVSLLVSDVIGDPLDVIGSGLTAPDTTTFADALAVLERYACGTRVPSRVLQHLQAGAQGLLKDTPKPGDERFRRVLTRVIASNRLALEAARAEALQRGYRAELLSSTLTGEAREVAQRQVPLLHRIVQQGEVSSAPVCLLSGGETTVTLRGAGKGGRNMEFALAAALAVAGWRGVLVLSAGTDGTDGPTDATGAIATGETVQRARAMHMDAAEFLEANDSYSFFERLGDLIRTGPTGTNVMDVQVMMAR